MGCGAGTRSPTPGVAKLALLLRGGKLPGLYRSLRPGKARSACARGGAHASVAVGQAAQMALSIIWVSNDLMFGGAPSWLEWTWPSLNINSMGMLRTL